MAPTRDKDPSSAAAPGGTATHIGIAPKLALTVALAFAFSLVAVLLLGRGFLDVARGVREIAEDQLPTLARAGDLLQEAQRLVALGPALMIARGQAMQAELGSQLAEIESRAEPLFRDLDDGGAPLPQIAALRHRFDALTGQLRTLTKLVGSRLQNEQQLADLTERLRLISGRIGQDPTSATESSCLDAWRAAARAALVALLAGQGPGNEAQVRRSELDFAQAGEALRATQDCAPGDQDQTQRGITDEILTAGNPGGVIPLRQRQLSLQYALDQQAQRGRRLGDALMSDLDRLLKRVHRHATAQSQAVQSMLGSVLALLALLPALLLVLALGTWAYLNRALVRPVLQLNAAIAEALADREPHFPAPRRDEVGALVVAVGEFIATLNSRERELLVAKGAAERANRTKGLFLAKISHELRAPLHAMLGYADLLRQDATLDPKTRQRCAVIRRSGKHLLHIIDGQLDIAAIEAGRVELAPTDLDLIAILNELESICERDCRHKGLAFNADRRPGVPLRVRTDGRRLRQVLTNLLDNAVKYTEHGWVNLNTEALPDGPGRHRLRFMIEDTGPGIAPADRERLFEPFQQLHPGQPGSGLGLAISRELALLMGGFLRLDSATGNGCRFLVEIPVEDPDPSPEVLGPTILGYLGPRRRILVVDDERVNLALFREILTRAGFKVGLADGAAAALQQVAQDTPDLVLMDLVMPGWCGYAASWALRQKIAPADLPIVAFSATPLDDPGDAQALGFQGFLPKPVDREDLLRTLGRLLDLTWTFAEGPDSGPAGALTATQGLTLCDPPYPESTALDAKPAPDSEPEAPWQGEIDTVSELARLGEWERVLDWCIDLASGDPSLAPFADQVRARARARDAADLTEWLDRQR